MEKFTAQRKNLLILAGFVLSLSVASSAVSAATCDPGTPFFCNPLNLSAGGGVQTLGDAVVIVVKYILSMIGVISLFYIIYSGIKYMISSGNQQKIMEAKNALISSTTGLILAMLAYSIVKTLEHVLRVK